MCMRYVMAGRGSRKTAFLRGNYVIQKRMAPMRNIMQFYIAPSVLHTAKCPVVGTGNSRVHRNMSITCSNFDAAEAWIRQAVKSGHPLFFSPTVFSSAMADAQTQFNMPVESLSSFLRSIHLIHVKKNAHVLRNNVKRHVADYVGGRRILEMARSMNYPPYHVARLIVENVADLRCAAGTGTGTSTSTGGNGAAGSASSNKKAVTEAMREPQRVLGDPSIVKPEYRSSEENGSLPTKASSSPPLSRLAMEVIEAMRSDPLYGPKQDRERQSVGLEHEEMLEKALEAMSESATYVVILSRILV